jgi:phosphoribosyl-ATP pyrophosphohydrolase
MKETQASISEWAEQTFGMASSNARVAARVNEEMAELIEAASELSPQGEDVMKECADVVIILCRLAQRMGFTLRLQFLPGDYGHHVNYDHSDYQTVAKANTYLASLLRALTSDDNSPAAEGHVDGLMVKLLQLAAFLDCDLMEWVDKKMAVNRQRVWKRDGSGHGYHVRDKREAQTV